ncbi:MAG: hypothetical protein VX589_01950 [Myxococcota bacterium]|nr:hypothetical protein [Myxococcota bacterium]
MGLTLRLGLFNALMHEVWRSGLLNIAIPREQSPLPALISSLSADGKLSPTVAPAPLASEAPLEIQIGELQLAVSQPTLTECDDDDDCEENQTCAPGLSDDDPQRCQWAPDLYTVSLRSGLDIAFVDNNLILALDEEPDVQGQLIAQRSNAPLAVGLLTVAVKGLVWDQLRDALQSSLDFGLGSVDIDPAILQAFVPNINALDAVPTFDENTLYPFGHPLIEGALQIRLGLDEMD